jgi:hypothetical protein
LHKIGFNKFILFNEKMQVKEEKESKVGNFLKPYNEASGMLAL